MGAEFAPTQGVGSLLKAGRLILGHLVSVRELDRMPERNSREFWGGRSFYLRAERFPGGQGLSPEQEPLREGTLGDVCSPVLGKESQTKGKCGVRAVSPQLFRCQTTAGEEASAEQTGGR